MRFVLNTGEEVIANDQYRGVLTVSSDGKIFNKNTSSVSVLVDGVTGRINGYSDDLEIRTSSNVNQYIDVSYSKVIERSGTMSFDVIICGLLLFLSLVVILCKK